MLCLLAHGGVALAAQAAALAVSCNDPGDVGILQHLSTDLTCTQAQRNTGTTASVTNRWRLIVECRVQ
jgi:hypothetical protein